MKLILAVLVLVVAATFLLEAANVSTGDGGRCGNDQGDEAHVCAPESASALSSIGFAQEQDPVPIHPRTRTVRTGSRRGGADAHWCVPRADPLPSNITRDLLILQGNALASFYYYKGSSNITRECPLFLLLLQGIF